MGQTAWDVFAVGSSPPAGGWSCSGYSAVITSDNATTTGVSSVAADSIGQSFTVASDLPLHSIEVYGGYIGASSNATIRIGTAKDLSTYIAEASITGMTTSAWNLFDMTATEATLPAGTYYWGIVETNGDVRLTYESNNSYAGGVKTFVGTSWTLGADQSASDFWFKINGCTP